MPYDPNDPAELRLPPTTPGGLATGVDGERLGATDVAANGQVAPPIETQTLGTLKIKPPEVNASSVGNSLRYPSEKPITADTDYVVFEFWQYNPPFGRDSTGDPGTNTTSSGTPSYKSYNASIDDLKKVNGLNPIILYMPEDIQTQYGQKWGGADFGSVASGLLNVVGTQFSLSGIPDNLPGVLKSTVFDKIRKGINQVAGASISENQILGGVTGSILNPNTEMMYDGPELRTLDLTFKMVPSSSTEAIEIKKICNTFKKAMLPQFGGTANSFFGGEKGFGAGNLIRVPSVCTMKYMCGKDLHPYLPQYKALAISNVAINFTPDGAYASYRDGAPVATQLKISLKEMKNIFSSEIEPTGATY